MGDFPSFALAKFKPVELAPPVAQRFTLEVSADAFFKAHCLLNNIEDKAARAAAKDMVRQKFDKYAVSTDHIKRRQLIFFPRREEISFHDGELSIANPNEAHLRLFDTEKDPHGARLGLRMEGFAKVADDAFAQMYEDEDAPAPDDLIHVTCSGYLSPSPAERLTSMRNWETTVTHSYHMGCYGAFPAVRMAHGFLASSRCGVTPPKAQIDIAHTELLSAHNNIVDLTAENIITMTLFSDGLIKYSLCDEAELQREGEPGFRILSMHEQVLPGSLDDMTWTPDAEQFKMSLTPMVPIMIKKHVGAFVAELVARAGLDPERAYKDMLFAVHPGGPKIVEHVQDALELTDAQVAVSRDVLRTRGNMSSATIPTILSRLLEEASVGQKVVAIGFGPGLTATGMTLQRV